MSKPTEKQIELSRKLWEAGLERDVWHGNWCVCLGGGVPLLMDGSDIPDEAMPILTLEDALQNMVNSMPSINYMIGSGLWRCVTNSGKKVEVTADNPTEAALEALLAVVEEG